MHLNPTEIKHLTQKWLPKLVAFRQQLHQRPETTPQLQQTLDLLKDKLAGCELTNIPLKHSRSLCMSLTGKEPGPTILFCANMAGSPLMDRDTDACHSLIPGFTHTKCNHDAEMATVVSLIWAIQKLKDKLAGTIKILFMADDINTVSSLRELQQSVLKNVKFAVHFEFSNRYHSQRIYYQYDYSKPRIDQFSIAYRDNPTYNEIKSNKTVFMAAKLVTQLPIIIKQTLGELTPIGFKFTKIHAQDAFNIQPHMIEIEGNLYTYDKELANATLTLITDLIQTQMLGPSAVLKSNMCYPPLYNDTSAMNQVLPIVSQFVNDQDLIEHPIPMLTNSNFSIISESIPSVELSFGTQSTVKENTSSHPFDESVLALALNACTAIVCQQMNRDDNVLHAKFDG